MSAKPPTHTVSTLAIAWGVDQAQVSRWKQAGMPFGKTGRIAEPVAIRWLREHERRDRARMGRSESDERRAAAEALLAEAKLAQVLSLLVQADAVSAVAEEEATRVRGIVSQLASEFAPLVAARCGCGLREASAVLRAVSDGLLSRLAAQDNDEGEAAA